MFQCFNQINYNLINFESEDRDFFFRFFFLLISMLYFSDNRYFSIQIRKVSSLSSHSEREKSRRNRNGSERKKLGREKKGIEIKWEDPDQNQEKEGNLKKKRNLKRIKSEFVKF